MSLPPDPLVRSAVRAARPSPAGACPDAEMLGLFAEGDLDAAERRSVETHLADCARCQATLEAFVRAAPDVEAASPAQDGVLAWFTGWRWLVPVASAAAIGVVAVWIGRAPSEEAARMEQDAVASAPAAAAPATPASPGAADAQVLPKVAESEATQFRAAPAQVLPPERREADRQRNAQAARSAQVQPEVATAEIRPPETELLTPAAPPALSPVPPPPAPAARADAAPEARQGLNAAAGSRDAAVAAEKARPQESLGVSAQARREGAAAASPALRVQPPDAWRVRDSRVERSTDQGRTWRFAATPGALRIIAVAPVSVTACWAIAPDAILRTIDGTTWTTVRLPSSEAVASITAADAVTATVTTVTGATWTTSDAGATWRRP